MKQREEPEHGGRVHKKAFVLGPEGSEEPRKGSEPGHNLVQISIKHSQEDGFSARAGIRAGESLFL